MVLGLGLAIGAAVLPEPANSQPSDALAAMIREDARRVCGAEWPDDFRMQRYCRDMAIEGGRRWHQLRANAQGIPALARALDACTDEWRSNGAVDWRMAAYCAEQQTEAWRELNGR